MATTSLDQLYQQYLGRTPDAAGAQYWNEQLAGGANLADVERAIAASSEAGQRSMVAAAPRVAARTNSPTFAAESRDVQFAEPMKVTAAAVSNVLRDLQGGQTKGEWVPESVLPNGQIKYKFEGTLGTPKLADVYGIYASLPDTVSSWGELADKVSYLQANPQQQLTNPPADQSRGYYGSLALAMDEAPGGQLTREQQQAIAAPYYAMTTDAEGNRGRLMKDLMYLRPGTDPYLQVSNANTAAQQLQQLNQATGTIAPTRVAGTQTLEMPQYGTVAPAQVGYGTTPAAYRPVTPLPFGSVLDQTMQPAATPFTMPQQPVFGGPINVPTRNPFETTYEQPAPITYPTQSQLPPVQYANPFEPAMFADGGEVGQPSFMEVGQPGFMTQAMSGQMPTYQYPAYGGMPQDVFDWTAPRVAQGQLIQPPRQAPAQFEAPLYTAPAMPGFGTQAPVTGRPYAATPIAPSPVVPGPGIVTPPPVTPTPPTPDTVVPPVDPSAAYRNQITGIYGDILNRTPDPTGLDYWTVMAKQGMSMDDIRRNIQLNENQQIAQIYKDVLGRDTPDAEGLAYWANSGQDMDTIRRNIQLNKEQQGIAALPAAQGPTVAAPVIAPVVAPPPPQQYFQTTNYESGEGYWLDVPASAAGQASGNSWYNSGDSAGDVGANPGPDAAADAAASAASDAAASNDGPGDAGNGDGDGNS